VYGIRSPPLVSYAKSIALSVEFLDTFPEVRPSKSQNAQSVASQTFDEIKRLLSMADSAE